MTEDKEYEAICAKRGPPDLGIHGPRGAMTSIWGIGIQNAEAIRDSIDRNNAWVRNVWKARTERLRMRITKARHGNDLDAVTHWVRHKPQDYFGWMFDD